ARSSLSPPRSWDTRPIIRDAELRYKLRGRLRRPLIPPAAPGLREIHTGKQQRQVGASHLNRSGRFVRPGKRPVLEPLVENPESGPIPRENFQPVAPAIPKQEQVP